jgi:hypothetical protein
MSLDYTSDHLRAAVRSLARGSLARKSKRAASDDEAV